MFKAIAIWSVLFVGALASFSNYQDNVIDLNGWIIEPRIPIDISSQPEPYPYRAPKLYSLPLPPRPPPPPAVVVAEPAKPITGIIKVQKVGLITSIVSSTICAVKKFVAFIFTSIPALALGFFGAIGVCKLTSLCQLSTLQAFIAAKDKILTGKLDFLKQALDKYNSL